MFFVDVSRHRFPCTCYKSFFLGRKTCSLLMCLGLGIVSHVHVINLSSLEERHVLCCCVSASCFPCTCYRSFFLGRKTCSLLMCLGIVSHVHVINVHGKDDAETQQQITCLPSKEKRFITCTWETMPRHINKEHVFLPRKKDL
jgi:hypothetical protein